MNNYVYCMKNLTLNSGPPNVAQHDWGSGIMLRFYNGYPLISN